MAGKQINARVITKHDKEENWNKATNFIPKLGELIVYEPDINFLTPRIKVGDGLSTIKTLPFITDSYIKKESGKGLSTNDFTDFFRDKIIGIPNDAKFTDTTYTEGIGIGIANNKIYNKGLVSISAGEKNGQIIFSYGSESNAAPGQFIVPGLEEVAFMTLDDLFSKITVGDQNGTIKVDDKNIPITGLTSTAFTSLEDLTSEIIHIGNSRGDKNSKIWIEVYQEYEDDDDATEPITVSILHYFNGEEYVPLNSNSQFAGGIVTGATSFLNITESTSTTTGAVTIAGGLGVAGDIYCNSINGSTANDYAEYRSQNEEIQPGYITYCDDDGKLKLTTEFMQKFEGVVSDTFGFSIGKDENNQTPIAVSGRVLVYCNPEEHFHSGDCVCAGPNGLAYRMTREEIIEFPDRIVGIVSEIPTYEYWGPKNIKTDGRIWIRVK